MKEKIKRLVNGFLSSCIALTGKTRIGELFFEQALNFSLNRVSEITHRGIKFFFVTPNSLCRWRIKNFSSNEPETLEWIDAVPHGSVLWDIGANIGLYSVYAAQKGDVKVYAFEPSVFNLELLARNIFLNKLSDKVCIVPLALNSQLSINQMRMTSTEWGGALSTFGEKFSWDGKTIKEMFSYQIIGLSMEDMVLKLKIPVPDYIKIDVDGLEHFILKGGSSVLNTIKGILIEVNDDFIDQAEQCKTLLTNAGLKLKEKRHSDEIDNSESEFQNVYNQIWVR